MKRNELAITVKSGDDDDVRVGADPAVLIRELMPVREGNAPGGTERRGV